MAKIFDIKELKALKYILVMEVSRSKEGNILLHVIGNLSANPLDMRKFLFTKAIPKDNKVNSFT